MIEHALLSCLCRRYIVVIQVENIVKDTSANFDAASIIIEIVTILTIALWVVRLQLEIYLYLS